MNSPYDNIAISMTFRMAPRDPKHRTEHLLTSMHSTIKMMIYNGIDLNMKDDNDVPLLHHIYNNAHGSLDTVTYAIEHGADESITDGRGYTLMHLAAVNDDVALLSKLSTDINVLDHEGRTPLFYAVSYNQMNAARLLLQKGANGNTVDVYDVAPIEKAYKKEHAHMVDLLCEYGVTFREEFIKKDKHLYKRYQAEMNKNE